MKQVYAANCSLYIVPKQVTATPHCLNTSRQQIYATIKSFKFLHVVVNPQYESEELQERGQFLNSGILDYTFVYLAHPGPVTGISWRKTSKYIPVYVNILYFSPEQVFECMKPR